jgi:hypothetical protein
MSSMRVRWWIGFCDETEAGCRHADRSAWAVKAGEELTL